jgi:hypothetical protein
MPGVVAEAGRAPSAIATVAARARQGIAAAPAAVFGTGLTTRALATLALATLASTAAAQPAPLLDAEGRIGPAWRVAGLPGQKAPLTRFTAVRIEGRDAIRIDADASYGNLVQDLPGQPAPRRLRWAWWLERPNPAVDLANKAGDDSAAKVCLAFDMPLERVPFVERQILRMARGKTGEPLPAATLCWAWGHTESAGALVPNPYSRRLRTIVLRNQADATGRWYEEERDVEADFKRAFGDESAELLPLAALIVAADADNTHGHSSAFVASVRFGP